ncbi:serine/threonine-protein phosphatase, partial [Kitasatospora sp. NPDC001225]
MRARSVEEPGPRLPVLIRYGHWSWLVPLAVLAAVVGVDAATPVTFASVSWLAMVPVVAAGLCGPAA